MEDYIVRATAAGGAVRAFAVDNTGMTAKAAQVHSMTPVTAAALGRSMAAAAMMAKTLKGEKDTITLQIKGDGPLGGIVVVSDSDANVRGYVYNPEVDIPLNSAGKLDVSAAVGKDGYLNVIKDFGLKEPYIGYVRLVSGEIAEDIAYYYAFSEQVPTVVALGVLISPDGSVMHAGGFILQLLPDADEEVVKRLEQRIAELPPVTTMLQEGKKPEDILEIIFEGKELKITDISPCTYTCNCSRERMERNLISLGREELKKLADEQDGAELQCHFCNSRYFFTRDELLELIQ